jgi:hypothetical protein
MPDIIDLEVSSFVCPFDATGMKKVVYFRDPSGVDEDDKPFKSVRICMTCGFMAQFYSAAMITEFQRQVDEAAPSKAALLDIKSKMIDSRKPHNNNKPVLV